MLQRFSMSLKIIFVAPLFSLVVNSSKNLGKLFFHVSRSIPVNYCPLVLTEIS